jgi:hypothetical protein
LGPGVGRVKPMLAGLAILSAVPALPVIGWIWSSLQHTRHLYLPSVWIALLFAVALSRTRFKTAIMVLFLIVQIAGLNWNMRVYREVLDKTRIASAVVESDVRAAGGQAKEVRLIHIPADPYGVWYFDSQLQHEIDSAGLGIPIRLCDSQSVCGAADKGTLLFTWDSSSESIKAVSVRSIDVAPGTFKRETVTK